ncbi:MAG: peptidoglycan DD-metalloendopeptidase family protein [Candidatus Doudnabacteria bacterium]|nr:peptidoglycan DD-metalloendopeptidase family protein [Candidatus Doudnabacteria bacterium]
MFKFKETKIVSLIVIFSTVFFIAGNFAVAQEKTIQSQAEVDQLNSQKSERQKKLEAINAQIKNFSQQIAEARSKSNSLKNEIGIFEKEIASTELQIEARQTQIEDTQTQISILQKLIDQKTKEVSENKQILASLIKQLHQFDNEYFLKTTIGAGNFSEFLDQVQFTQSYNDKVYQIVQKIKQLKARLEAQEKDLKLQLDKLQELKDELEQTMAALDEQRNQKQKLLNQTRGVESNYQKLLTASKNEEDKLQKEIDDLDSQIRTKLGNKTIAAKKGVLAWPMDGILTQKYGNTGFTALGYNFHNGIDIAAPAGTPIYAAADGEVMYTDKSDASYGNWAALKHNISTKTGSAGIITLYAHMRTIKVTPGQKVKQGDLVGYEGNSGNTTKKLYGAHRGYHIHFGVYDAEGFGVKDGAYTNVYGAYRIPYGYTYNPISFLE